jgi:glycerate kinase
MRQPTLKIAVAPDSFKGTLTAMQAATCIERGLKKSMSSIRVRKIPMADGGEGTVRAIVDATGGRLVLRTVSDPLGRRVRARFGLSGNGRTAVIEMAAASGLGLLEPDERNPLVTSTGGTGELVRHALSRGADRILVGIGGSATNDAGMGMARVLGARFLDKAGRELPGGGGSLGRLAHIDPSGLDPRLRGVTVEVACDVDNPLFGARGAARVYAPQKGATRTMVNTLDAGLRRFAAVVRRDLGVDVAEQPGAGAAGGLGAGIMALLGGTLRPGVDIVIEAVGLRRRLKGTDLVVTGEGRLDGQTVHGKTPAGVARVARELGIPVIAIAGSLGEGADRVHAIGIEACFSALRSPVDEQTLARRGPGMLTDCAEQVGRLLALRIPGPGKGRGGATRSS